MPDLKMMEINGTTLIAIEDPRIVAAMKAFDYVWSESPKTEARVKLVVRNLEELCAKLAGTGSPKAPIKPANGARKRA
ncbi:MAG TPA: hypothetical protein VII91_00970 [Bauldia sp.]